MEKSKHKFFGVSEGGFIYLSYFRYKPGVFLDLVAPDGRYQELLP